VIQPVIYSETEKDLLLPAKNLIIKAGLKENFSLIQLAGGKNNRVFQLKGNENSYLLKSYFRHVHDPRDRLKAEYSFISFAWKRGIKTVPKPIAFDNVHGLGLYEFIDGKKLCADEVQKDHIKQAAQFFIALNKKKNHPEAYGLPIASEACFSINDHLNCVDNRLNKLKSIKAINKAYESAKRFVEKELIISWAEIKENTYKKVKDLNLIADKPISNNEKELSPSDFGFHNALLQKNDQVRFIDFEYAGWDDPAKMICDFFCQPEVPVSFDNFSLIEAVIINHCSDPKVLQEKIRLLFPVYKIKWCCIMLNDFLEIGNNRRNFALNIEHNGKLKIRQLEKTKTYFQSFLENRKI